MVLRAGTANRARRDRTDGQAQSQLPEQKCGQFVQLPHFLLNSAAYRSIGLVARCALIELIRSFNGFNGLDRHVDVRHLGDLLPISRATAARALNELEERGVHRTDGAERVLLQDEDSIGVAMIRLIATGLTKLPPGRSCDGGLKIRPRSHQRATNDRTKNMTSKKFGNDIAGYRRMLSYATAEEAALTATCSAAYWLRSTHRSAR